VIHGKEGRGLEAKEFFQKNTLKCIIGGFAAGVIFSVCTSAGLSFSGSPAFCGQCHAMKMEKATFMESSHRERECVDCHLPHDSMTAYFVEKGRSGMIDVYHELKRDYPAKIRISEDAEKIVNGNCLRCHSATMAVVHAGPMDANTDCLKCHRSVAHGSNHLEGGIKVE